MNNLLLDTHTWLWFVNGDTALTTKNQQLINHHLSHAQVFVAAISTWEVAMLEKKQRIILEMPCLEWVEQSLSLTGISVAALTPKIAIESCHLPGQFHEDPADRLIVATARIADLVLLTRDQRILTYSQQHHCKTQPV